MGREAEATISHEPRVVYLLDAAGPVEHRILRDWVRAHGPADAEVVALPPSRRARRRRLDPRLEASLAADDDPLLSPLRVAWLPGRTPRLLGLLLLGDPRDPGRLRQRWRARRRPDLTEVVVGDPAPVSELRERWRRAGGPVAAETTGLAEFVTRQAWLALERAERRLRGTRYKVPRFVAEEIVARPAFRAGLGRLARELGRDPGGVEREAGRCLREIAAAHSPYVIDLCAHLIRLLYTRGYRAELQYDRAQLGRIYALGQRHPVVFLPSHKSNLDHLVLQYALHENGHPPNHTAGGINMNFLPVGPLVRRSGVFFIRRTFRDDPLYKLVLRHYVGYLIEKRFSLEWYVEGGRSRSGKLLPPRFGLLANVVDAFRRGRSEDVHLIPVAIAYDQISDVGSYTAEQRGAAKERESLGWFLRVVRGLRRRYGSIHIRFGEPLSLAEALGRGDVLAGAPAEEDAEEESLAVQKLAFEVCVRINGVTPVTPTSLVTLSLLGRGDRALTVPEIVRAVEGLVGYVHRRGLPTTRELELDTAEGVERALASLVENGVVTCYAEGVEPVYAVGPDQHMTAAYYRNTIAHFFVTGAIVELALLRAAEDGVEDRVATFLDEALRLRDLLKFEFFFAGKDRFRQEVRDEVALHDPAWARGLADGAQAALAVVRRVRPFNAHRVLRPFLESYRVVGDALAHEAADAPVDRAPFLERCMALGRQYLLQRRVHSAESVSRVLFDTALRLARNRGLLDAGGPDLADRRHAFARELRAVLGRIDAVDALAASRRSGLIA
jgi:glycerol-3-phosphate O-acyltransferase